jgi:hypothetical protein
MQTPFESEYRTIPLTQGQFALVSAEDHEYLSQWKWCAQWSTLTQAFYAIRSVKKRGSRNSLCIQMATS